MSSTAGSKGMGVEAMEMESLKPSGRPAPASQTGVSLVDKLWTLTKLYMEYYPKVTTFIIFFIMGILMYMIAPNFRPTVERNRLNHDYSSISKHYAFQASQIDHWCLWGGDDKCMCLDFTAPEGYFNDEKWMVAHGSNKKYVKKQINDMPYDSAFDIVFVGDEMVEKMRGKTMGSPTADSIPIGKIVNETFEQGNQQLKNLYLGIQGDQTSNILWRMAHGELPQSLEANVYWVWAGTNDLLRGYCSEEATVLGILNTAEYLSWRDPDSIVVIQGLLPFSSHSDGTLSSDRKKRFRSKAHSVAMAKSKYYFWPSIEAVNLELRKFCANHPQIVYFEASELFVGQLSNKHHKQETKFVMHELMSEDNIHPNQKGYRLLAEKIKEEYLRIRLDDNFDNDVEKKEPVKGED